MAALGNSGDEVLIMTCITTAARRYRSLADLHNHRALADERSN